MNTEKPTGAILFDHVLTSDEYAAAVKQEMERQAMSEQKLHQWRIEVLYDGFQRRVIEYDGTDYAGVCETLGQLLLYSKTVDVLKIFRDNEQLRHIEVR